MEDMTSNGVPFRRRGRPSGKNRAPLSLNERRARNAQYERERRLETAEAMSELAAAAGCDPGLNNAEILATVISQLQRAAAPEDPDDDIQMLKRRNEKLIQQLEIIEERLSNMEDTQIIEENNNRKRRHNNEAKQSKRKKNNPENTLDIPFAIPSNNIYNN